MTSLSRRRALAALASGVAVVGFDAGSGRWIAQAHAGEPAARGARFAPLPPLDGELVTDPALLAAVADDFGHLVSRTPVALLLPGSVADIAKMLRYARRHGIRVAGRGTGHTAFGQAQAQAGLVIDVSTLGAIGAIGTDRVTAEAGALWRDVLQATLAQGRTPPVLTDYTALSVGGTLSLAGLSGSSHRHGAQIDNVLALRVVTGEGRIVDCSPQRHRDLFEAALGGLGLCAVIVAATLRLVPARARARTYRVLYADVPSLLRDLRVLADGERFDHVAGSALVDGAPGGSGDFVYAIEATAYYDRASDLPADPLAGLDPLPGLLQELDRSYFEFTDLVYQLSQQLIAAGLWGLPHPWLDLFVADDRIERFAVDTLAGLDRSLFLPGSIVLFYPLTRAKLTRPLLRMPDTPRLFLFDILRTIPDVPAIKAATVAENRRLYDSNRRSGGRFYAISALPMDRVDWIRHFAPEYGRLLLAKLRHDPGNVLGAGLDVF